MERKNCTYHHSFHPFQSIPPWCSICSIHSRKTHVSPPSWQTCVSRATILSHCPSQSWYTRNTRRTWWAWYTICASCGERGRGNAKPENMDSTDTNGSFPVTYMFLVSPVAPAVLVEIVPQAVPSAPAFQFSLEHQRPLRAHPDHCCQVDQCCLGFRPCHCGPGVPWILASLSYPSSLAFRESPVREG